MSTRTAARALHAEERSSLEELLTPPSVATLLGVSPPSVYAALKREGAAIRHLRTPGGQIRIRRRDLLAYCHRNGLMVPKDLVRSPSIVVVHPDRRTGSRICRSLEPVARPTCCSDLVQALVTIGGERPPVVMLSDQLGTQLVARTCEVLAGSSWLGYTCVLTLVAGKAIPWDGGPVPVPLAVGESAGRTLTALVGTLLGTI